MSGPLLSIEELSVEFRTRGGGRVRALDRVSLRVEAGETLGLVGESGSGKSVTALSVLGLLDPAARVTGGCILFEGRDLRQLGEAGLRALRGSRVSMVFQQPRRALNPIRPVGRQLADVLRAHGKLTRRAAAARAVALLAEVGIARPEVRVHAYPFQLSGGQCQRVMIALALAGSPALLIADEPTTGLDVTTQAAVMDLIGGLARRRGLATLLITHDLGLAAERCARIAVMQAGRVVETAETATLFERPAHPYTRALIRATPQPSSRLQDLAP